jgi:molybdopterin converting factor subunit 1
MKINVVFYGGLKEETGTKHQTVEIAHNPATIADLVETIKAQYPALVPRLDTVAYVIGNEIVDLDHPLRDGDEAALLPPVSGG